MITPLPGIARGEIARERRSLWRYAAALPIDDPRSRDDGRGLHAARRAPLGRRARAVQARMVFADRQLQGSRRIGDDLGFAPRRASRRLLEDSSGNGGAAIAAYAAAGGAESKDPRSRLYASPPRPCRCAPMAPRSSSCRARGRRRPTRRSGNRAAIFYASHNWQPFFLQGTKTLAYELWEDLGFRAPDNVVIPTGAGSNVLGCDIGFGELLRRGEIAALPRLFAAQPENCGPIAAAFDARADSCSPFDARPTIAEGTAIASPVRPREVLAALRRSGGGAVAVSEEAIVEASRQLADSGLYAEPTSAVAAAGLTALLRRGAIGPQETTVVVLTGGGLKATQVWSELTARY